MRRSFFTIVLTLILSSSASLAETVYVVDHFKIMVRRQPGERYKIVAQLPTDEKVERLKVEGDWALISFGNDQKGWVLKRYLTEETPKPIQIAKLEHTVNDLTEKIEALESENISLKQKSAEWGESLAAQAEELKNVSLENQRLREKPYRIVLLISGGAIFLGGCMVTLIVQRTGRSKKKNKLSF